MPKSSNSFWLTSMRTQQNWQNQTVSGITSGVAGATLATLTIIGDQAIAGLIITCASVPTVSVGIAAFSSTTSILSDGIVIPAGNTIVDSLFGTTPRVTGGNLLLKAVNTFSGVNLTVQVFYTPWSNWISH